MEFAVRMIGLAALFSLCGCVPFLPTSADPCSSWSEPGTYRLSVDGYERTPLIYVPQTSGPRPAVVMLHGAGGSERNFAWQVTDVIAQAEANNYVAIFVNGAGAPGGYTWNAVDCCGTAQIINADDLGFLDKVVSTAREQACVGPVLAAGHSNGSMMAQHWACESDAPDAVYGVSGPLLDKSCAGAPIPVQIVVGETDRIVPIDGGKGVSGPTPFPSSDAGLAPWLERNQCASTDPTTTSPSGRTEERWTCAAPTGRTTFADWGHAWPGGRNGDVEGYVAEAAITQMVLDLAASSPD